jgi:L-fuculose-phosphate aldolase
MVDLERELRRAVAAICREMYERRYVVATEGNVSCRLDARRLLVTPTSFSKGRLTEDDLVVTDMRGRRLEGTREPTTEIALHLKVYEERPDVNAVVHAHPPFSIALTLAGRPLARESLPELLALFGDVPVAPYGSPGTEDLARSIEGLIRHTNAIILDKHGTLTVGRTPVEAYENLERIEWAAEITVWAALLGRVDALPPEEVARLIALRRR